MYPVSTQAEASRAYPAYERRVSYSNDHGQSYANVRPHIELPRPLEPRPSLHTSLSEASGIQRRHDTYRSPLSPDYRSHGQNLPGLRDILSPGPQASSSPSYGTTWNTSIGTSATYQPSEGQLGRSGHSNFHPPMALYPPADHSARYQTQQGRSFEVPILDTSPVTTHSMQPAPLSPFSGYPDSVREYADLHSERPGPATSANSYMTNRVSSPYTPAGSEDVHYRTQASTYERTVNPAYVPAGADNQKKYLGVKDVAGEGAFHFYEGGHRIPTHVDGEQVNPAWGLTKANKPRKRLALACLDCREKKIKCEPGASSCLQCEKAKRICRRLPLQGSQTDIPTTSWQGTAASPVRKGASQSDPTPTTNRDTEPDPLNKRRSRESTSPPNVPSKKHRSASPVFSTQDVLSLPGGSSFKACTAIPTTIQSSSGDVNHASVQWEDDPFSLHSELTLHLLDIYFAYINNTTYCMYPRSHFMHYVRNYPDKCQNERLLLYAMLAAASIFAEGSLSGFGKQCAQLAGDAISAEVGRFNMTIAQAKMLLALYHFAKGSTGLAWEYSGAAIRTITHLRYNSEDGCQDDSSSMAQPRIEFALSRTQLAECKRRTFWSAFLMDRYSGATTCIMKPEDTFVRLPCTDGMYDRSEPSDAPFFANEVVDPTATIITPASPLAPMAWLVLVGAIWGDVVEFVFRAPFRPKSAYPEIYNTFYSDTWNRLQGWCSRLPLHLQYNEANLERSIQEGYADTFISMHTLYHFTHMKMNRSVRHALVPELLSRNIRAAHSSGHQMLQMMNALRTTKREIAGPAEGQPPLYSFSTPFAGYATLTAIDVVGAGEWESNLGTTIAEIDGALDCLRELSKYWSSAKDQFRACETRAYQIKNIVTKPTKSHSGAWLGRKWGMEMPLERDFNAEHDCIYGLGDSNEARQIYFEAFNDEEGITRTQSGGLRIA